jgi:predicted small metal-binding protein
LRVIDCECGTTLKAANDEELANAVRGHVAAEHPEMELNEDGLRELVEGRAYDASDA